MRLFNYFKIGILLIFFTLSLSLSLCVCVCVVCSHEVEMIIKALIKTVCDSIKSVAMTQLLTVCFSDLGKCC